MNTTSPASQTYDTSIKFFYVSHEESITSDTYSRPPKDVKYTTYVIIKTKHVSRSHTTDMLATNITVYEKPQSFSTPMNNNNSAIEPSDQVMLVFYTMKCQHNTTSHMKLQKIPQSGKEYLCCQADGITAQAAHYAK